MFVLLCCSYRNGSPFQKCTISFHDFSILQFEYLTLWKMFTCTLSALPAVLLFHSLVFHTFCVSQFQRFTVSLLKSLNVLVFHISSVYQLQRFPVAVFHIFSVPRFTFSSSISQFQRDTVSVRASQFQCFIGRWLLHVRRTLLLLRDSSSGSMKRSLVVRQLLVLPVLLRK